MLKVSDERIRSTSFALVASTLLASVAALAIFAASPAHAESDDELQEYAAGVAADEGDDEETAEEAGRLADEDDLEDGRRPSFRPTFRPPVFRPVVSYRPPVLRPTYRPVSRPTYRPVTRPISRPIYRPVTRPSRPAQVHRPRPSHPSRPIGHAQRPQQTTAHRPVAGRPAMQPTGIKPQGAPAQAIPERPHTPQPPHAATSHASNAMNSVQPIKVPATSRPSQLSPRPSPSSDAIVQSAIAALESLAIYMTGEPEVPLVLAPTGGPSLPLPAPMTKPTDPGFYLSVAAPTGILSGPNGISLGCGVSSGCEFYPTHSLTMGSASLQATNNVEACITGLTLGYAAGVAASANADCVALGAGASIPFPGSSSIPAGILTAPSYGDPALGSGDEGSEAETPEKLGLPSLHDNDEEGASADDPQRDD